MQIGPGHKHFLGAIETISLAHEFRWPEMPHSRIVDHIYKQCVYPCTRKLRRELIDKVLSRRKRQLIARPCLRERLLRRRYAYMWNLIGLQWPQSPGGGMKLALVWDSAQPGIITSIKKVVRRSGGWKHHYCQVHVSVSIRSAWVFPAWQLYQRVHKLYLAVKRCADGSYWALEVYRKGRYDLLSKWERVEEGILTEEQKERVTHESDTAHRADVLLHSGV